MVYVTLQPLAGADQLRPKRIIVQALKLHSRVGDNVFYFISVISFIILRSLGIIHMDLRPLGMWIFDSSCGKRPRTRGNGPEVREFKSKTVAPEPYMFVTNPPTLDPLTKKN